MTASKPPSDISSADRRGQTDLAKVDAHIVQPHEYEELPELTDAFFDEADLHAGGKLIRRGRPRLERPKKLVSLRIDQAALETFRATGSGWQTRMNEALIAAAQRLGRK